MKTIALPFTALALCCASQVTCATGSTRRTAQITVVTAGGIVAGMHKAHQEIYRQATNGLIATLREHDGSIAEYELRVKPIDEAFTQRSQALQMLATALYGAAAVMDSVQKGASAADYQPAAKSLLEALDQTVHILQDARVLPAIPMPQELETVLGTLEVLAGTTIEVRDAA